MRKFLVLAAAAVGGLVGSAGAARADGWDHRFAVPVPDYHARHGGRTSSVTWPSVDPPGWYTDTYRHKWYFPWYAYYNFSSGPYANWAAGGGHAGYTNHGPAGFYHWGSQGGGTGLPSGAPSTPAPAAGAACTVAVTLPADAKLFFNGTAASGTGAVRKFQTPPLVAGQSYKYELTAEITRDGRTERVTESVIVRAGETATVTLAAPVVATASK